jgi:hypothetical protein
MARKTTTDHMALPTLDGHGLLPAGIHPGNEADLRDRFCWNSHRQQLFIQLIAFLAELRKDFPTEQVYVDGSFVTDKEFPSDVDLVLDGSMTRRAQLWKAVGMMQLDQNNIKAKYGVDFWVDIPGGNSFTSFFQYVGIKTAALKRLSPRHNKGIVLIK